jgi:tetratricopeptide (TPR) repeat protein
VVFGVLGQAAYVYTKLDRLDEAKRLAEVMIAMDPLAPRWGPGFGLLLVADRLDLRDAVRRAFEDDYGGHRPEPYLAVAAESRFDEAADIAEDIGEIEVEAELRCAAAEAFFAEGRTIEAADQLERALEFFRSVRATRLIRELEAQLETIRATVR